MKTQPIRQTVQVLVILGVLLALTGITAIVVAGPLAQATGSEDGVMTAHDLPAPISRGDDPDEDGYTGAPYQAAGGETEASEPGATTGVRLSAVPVSAPQPDEEGYTGPLFVDAAAPTDSSEEQPPAAIEWIPAVPGPQPDDNLETGAAATLEPEWSSFFHYQFIAGTTLRPRSSAAQWSYPGGGCVYSNSTNEIYNVHLNIPHGSRIDYLRIYYYDTSSANGQAWVTDYNGAGAATDLKSVSSSGNAGYGYAVSTYVGHVVNTATRSYVLNWRPNQTGASMQLCGLRVAYRMPS